MANPFDQFDSAQTNGPVYGPAPKVDPYRARDQELQEQAAVRAEEDQRFQREKFEREMAKGVGVDAKLVESERNAAFLATRVAGGLQDLNAAIAQDPDANKPSLGPSIAGVFGDGARNLANSPARRQVEAAQMDILDAALTLGTGAAYTKEQLEAYRTAYFPALTDDPETVAAKRHRLVRLLEAAKLKAGNAAPSIDQALANLNGEAVTPEQADQSRNLAEIEAPSGQQLARSTNGYETVDNPELSGVRGEYLRRLESGQRPSELIQFLRSAGIQDPKILRSAVEQANFRRQNPNVPIANYNIEALDDMDVPLSGIEGAMNDAAQGPVGAYAMHAGQAASMNTLDNAVGLMGGNAERARIGLEDASNAHPVASAVGDLSGGVMAAFGAEGALGGLGMVPGFGRAVLADASFGAGTGAGAADNGNRATGAVQGGLAGLVGSVAGQGLVRGVGSAISPTGGKLSDLYAAGVRPTPGQRMIAAGGGKGLPGLAGRAVNAAEEGISSVPIVGSAIRGARQDARDQFQIGAYNEALKEVGKKLPKGMKPGTAPYAFTKKAFDEAYDKARSGMRLAADEELSSQVGELAGELGNLAEPSIRRFESIVRNVLIRRVQGDMLDGAALKKIQSEIGDTVRGIRKNQSGDGELADKLEQLSGILDSAARRHSDPAAVKLLDETDAGYAKFVRIRDAAKARGGGAGEFSPTQFDRSVQKNTSGKHSDAYLRGDALMQDYAGQGMSLVDRMPNSGSADRLFMGAGAAGGAAMIEPNTLGLLGVLGALYSPGVRKTTAGSMAPRGPKAKAIADQVRKRARIAGAGGAALASQTSADR
jgi:hypothetical protein